MSSFTIVPGQTVKDLFAAYEDNGVSRRSGLTLGGGDFIVTVYHDCVIDPLTVTISEVGATGTYCLEYTPPTEGYWVVEVRIDFSDDILCSQAAVGVQADLLTVITNLDRALGLLHMNSFVDKQEFNDANDQLTKWRLRHFNTASNVPVNEGGNETTGLLHEYEFEAEYSGQNKPKKLRVRKIQ